MVVEKRNPLRQCYQVAGGPKHLKKNIPKPFNLIQNLLKFKLSCRFPKGSKGSKSFQKFPKVKKKIYQTEDLVKLETNCNVLFLKENILLLC